MPQPILIPALIGTLFMAQAAPAAAQPGGVEPGEPDRARVMGTVIDTSGGALPGVTVTLVGSGIPPTPVFTDAAGRYLTLWVPPGRYNISFTLSGFETTSVMGLALGAGQTVVLDQQLPLAALSETVEVTAPAPAMPPAPKPPPPPRPKVKPTEELLASVCGPRQPPEYSLARGRIVSHRDDARRELLGPGDALRIDAGEEQGMAAGQTFVIRRRFQTGDRAAAKKVRTFGEQTVGLLQITATDASSSSAIVVYACAEIFAGDTVEPYIAQPARFTVRAGTPRFDEPARIAFGEGDRQAASAGQMMVIDRGMMQGIQRGQRLTIFRPSAADGRLPVTVGEGVIVAIRPDSATIRIELATDAVYVGDLVALHR